MLNLLEFYLTKLQQVVAKFAVVGGHEAMNWLASGKYKVKTKFSQSGARL
jgi:hypothetical protein